MINNWRWFISKGLRKIAEDRKQITKLLAAQRDLIKPAKIKDLERSLSELDKLCRGPINMEALQAAHKEALETAEKILIPYPDASYRDWVEMALVVIALVLAFRTFFFQPFKIPTGSMQPTLYGITVEDLRDRSSEALTGKVEKGTLTATGDIFYPSDQGRTISFKNGNNVTISKVLSKMRVKVEPIMSIEQQPFTVKFIMPGKIGYAVEKLKGYSYHSLQAEGNWLLVEIQDPKRIFPFISKQIFVFRDIDQERDSGKITGRVELGKFMVSENNFLQSTDEGHIVTFKETGESVTISEVVDSNSSVLEPSMDAEFIKEQPFNISPKISRTAWFPPFDSGQKPTLNNTIRDLYGNPLEPPAKGSLYSPGEFVYKLRVKTGDHLFVNRLTYNFRHPRRGDISVFTIKKPDATHGKYSQLPTEDTFYIKRLVGLGGEQIFIGLDRHLRINNRRLNSNDRGFEFVYGHPKDSKRMPLHPVINSEYSGHQRSQDYGPDFSHGNSPYLVPNNHYLFFGDNTASSMDSRSWGALPMENVIGHSSFVYWPPLSARFGWSHR
tara:strand:+ start:3524 stop:5185 length:1662 start_codon:yes stop_codon:yes gene_type:complete